jgi:CRP-like cAMP-binding protein
MIEQLIDLVKAVTGLPLEEERKFRAIVNVLSLKKGSNFIDHGTVPRRIAFVSSGLFRYYYIDEKGNEYTKGFFPELSFITSYTAMIKNKPSHYTIEALEDSQIVAFDYHDWQALYKGHPCWSALLVSLLEKGFSKKENRERELLLFDAEARYRSFLNEYPHLETRIKQHQVASYLGITPVALSRIRKGMADVKIL